MVRVRFAKAFRRHVECPPADLPGGTVGDALAAYFSERPAVRTYVLDDTGAVRSHVAIFHNDDQVRDRVTLTDEVRPGDRIDVFQALSGGT